MGTAEEERKERIRRNEAMLRIVTDAADDLASCVPANSVVNNEAARREELKERLAAEAQQHGSRKSSRLASSAAKTRIFKSLQSDDAPGTESTSASGSIETESSSDDNDLDLRESPSVPDAEEVCANPVSSQGFELEDQDGPLSQEEQDMQLAIAISLADDGVGQKGMSLAKQSDADEDRPRGQSGSRAARVSSQPATKKKSGRKRKKRLDIEDADIDAIFDFIGEGKVTIGRPEFVSVINKLGLDVDEAMVDAAFEVLEESDCAGPCNRLDRASLRRFVVQLED